MDCTQRLWDLIRSQRVGPRFALDLSPKLRQTVNPWGKAGQHRSNAGQTHAMRRQTGSMARGRLTVGMHRNVTTERQSEIERSWRRFLRCGPLASFKRKN